MTQFASSPAGPSQIAAIRRFNRFYSRTAGLLDEKLTQSRFTLTEARVIFEIGAGGRLSAGEIAGELGIDPAYLARILKRFVHSGLVTRGRNEADGRRLDLALTPEGEAEFAILQERAEEQVAGLLAPLSDAERQRLSLAMLTVEQVLAGRAKGCVELRPHRPGDIGWVVGRQAALYAGEYGWDGSYEALAAEIGAAFLRDFREGADYCWIAELDGERAGAVFLMHQSDDVTKLRLLHVEAFARGRGIGSLLVDACVAKARAYGYRRLVLWTNDVLAAARHIYQRAGFRLVAEEKHHSFGKDLVGQNWELEL